MKMVCLFAAVGLLGTATLLTAQEAPYSSSRQVAAPTTAPARELFRRERIARLREAADASDFSNVPKDPPTLEEWAQISSFTQENFPNRWSVFQRMRNVRGEDNDAVAAIKLKIAVRYRALTQLQKDFPYIYRTSLEQARREDDAWGTLLKMRRNPSDATLKEQLRDKVFSLVQAVLKQRAARLENLQSLVDEEKRVLDDDQSNINQVVDRQMTRLLSDEPFGGPIETGRVRWGAWIPDPSPPPGNGKERSGPTTQPKNQ